jgi:hypothetical protein
VDRGTLRGKAESRMPKGRSQRRPRPTCARARARASYSRKVTFLVTSVRSCGRSASFGRTWGKFLEEGCSRADPRRQENPPPGKQGSKRAEIGLEQSTQDQGEKEETPSRLTKGLNARGAPPARNLNHTPAGFAAAYTKLRLSDDVPIGVVLLTRLRGGLGGVHGSGFGLVWVVTASGQDTHGWLRRIWGVWMPGWCGSSWGTRMGRTIPGTVPSPERRGATIRRQPKGHVPDRGPRVAGSRCATPYWLPRSGPSLPG